MGGVTPLRLAVLGRVHGLFGVHGWIKVYSDTRPLEAIFDYDRWWIGENGQRNLFYMLEGRVHGKTLVARLGNAQGDPLSDRDKAAGLLDLDIAVDRDDMPDPDPGEYYWFDLVGLHVVTLDNVDLGRVTAMMETGANDVLVVNGDRERLIPMIIDQYVTEIDLGAGYMVVDWEPDF